MFFLKHYNLILLSIILHTLGIQCFEALFSEIEFIGTQKSDPHFQTFDGTKYSFNGYGEYVLFKVDEIKFDVQSRMTPFKNSNGQDVQGTVITAIVLKGQNTDTVQFELKNGNSIEILINGMPLKTKPNQIIRQKGLRLFSKKNEYFLKYTNGIRIIIKTTEKQNALSTIIRIPARYKTKGLLGVMDKDPSNDFTLPDGKILKLDPTNDKQIFHEFGEKWRVSKDESKFKYSNGFSYDSFNKKDFIPKFMSDGIVFSDKNLEKLAIKVCGDNKDCLFDISLTGDIDIGKMDVEIEDLVEEIENLAERK